VAIKILPREFSIELVWAGRFERDAQHSRVQGRAT
jgi:hypothetical protein